MLRGKPCNEVKHDDVLETFKEFTKAEKIITVVDEEPLSHIERLELQALQILFENKEECAGCLKE